MQSNNLSFLLNSKARSLLSCHSAAFPKYSWAGVLRAFSWLCSNLIPPVPCLFCVLQVRPTMEGLSRNTLAGGSVGGGTFELLQEL